MVSSCVRNKLNLTPQLISATIQDYSIIQNMSPFYIYDISRHCGFNSLDWSCPENGYECIDYKNYFTNANHYPFLVKVAQQFAGFVLIDKVSINKKIDWNIGQFFIIGKFQGTGVAAQIFKQVLTKFVGWWEVAVIPENTPAVKFWRRVINEYTNKSYLEETKLLEEKYKRIVFSFNNSINYE